MSEQEYFVRQPDAENARGPFSVDKLQSLVEAGQLDRQSLYYDDALQDWKRIGDSPELCAVLFPEKKKLTLRRRGAEVEAPAPAAGASPVPDAAPAAQLPDLKPVPRSEAPASAPAPVLDRPAPTLDFAAIPDRSGLAVADILDAAEGNTEEMRLLRIQRKWLERAVALSLPMMAALMLLSSAALLGAHWESLLDLAMAKDKRDWMLLLEGPDYVLGAVDLFFALMLALAVTQFYPLLRLRLMLGLGYFGWMAYAGYAASGELADLAQLGGLVVFSVGVYVCTLTLNFWLMLGCGVVAFLGIVAFGLLRALPSILP